MRWNKLIIGVGVVCIATAAHSAKKDTAPVWSQEPESFLGIGFDKELDHQLKQCPEDYSLPSNICYEKPFLKDYYSLFALPNLGLMYGYTGVVITHESKVREIILNTKVNDYDTVKEMLIQKYGRPKSQAVETVTTKMGASFNNDKLYWEGKKISIIFSKYADNINESKLSVVNKPVAIEAIESEKGKLIQNSSKF